MLRRQEILDSFGIKSYQAYLSSPHWANFRKAYLESRLPKKCLACGNPDFHLHHTTYETLGFERLYDVVPLCQPCHTELHKVHKESHIPLNNPKKVLRKMRGWTFGEANEKFLVLEHLRRLDKSKKKPTPKPKRVKVVVPSPLKFDAVEDKSPSRCSYKRISDNIDEFKRLLQSGASHGTIAGKFGIKLYYVQQYIEQHNEELK